MPLDYMLVNYFKKKNLCEIKKMTNNAKDTNYFTKYFTNCWCDEWLLVNEKVILIVDLDENQ